MKSAGAIRLFICIPGKMPDPAPPACQEKSGNTAHLIETYILKDRMHSRFIVGVMGPGEGASGEETVVAFELGRMIGQRNWVLLTGGRNAGVMDAASRGAQSEGGIVVGILPGPDASSVSPGVDIPIITGMHEARNSINVLSSQLLFFIGMNPGTASELSLALKHRKPCILLYQKQEVLQGFQAISDRLLETADTVLSAVEKAEAYRSKHTSLR